MSKHLAMQPRCKEDFKIKNKCIIKMQSEDRINNFRACKISRGLWTMGGKKALINLMLAMAHSTLLWIIRASVKDLRTSHRFSLITLMHRWDALLQTYSKDWVDRLISHATEEEEIKPIPLSSQQRISKDLSANWDTRMTFATSEMQTTRQWCLRTWIRIWRPISQTRFKIKWHKSGKSSIIKTHSWCRWAALYPSSSQLTILFWVWWMIRGVEWQMLKFIV